MFTAVFSAIGGWLGGVFTLLASWTTKIALALSFYFMGKGAGDKARAEHGVEVLKDQVKIAASPPKDRTEIIDKMKGGQM